MLLLLLPYDRVLGHEAQWQSAESTTQYNLQGQSDTAVNRGAQSQIVVNHLQRQSAAAENRRAHSQVGGCTFATSFWSYTTESSIKVPRRTSHCFTNVGYRFSLPCIFTVHTLFHLSLPPSHLLYLDISDIKKESVR